MYLHDNRNDLPDTVREGDSGWVIQWVLSGALFRRQPLSGQKSFTGMSLHISNNCAKKRGIGKKLLLTIRAVMLEEKVDLVTIDFNGAAWRRTICASTLSIIEEAVADCDLPLPPGSPPLWGPGAVPGAWSDVCGFIKPPDSSERWRVRQHGAFPVRHEALGIRQTDQSCHHEVWLHLDFVDRCARATNSLERTFSAVPLQQTERSHKRGCQGPFAFFVIRRPFAASLGSALRTTRATCCDFNAQQDHQQST